MEDQKVRLSLRYKLLGVLTVLPLLSLAAYLLMATRLFENDKIAYVFDSSVAASRSLSNQLQVGFDSFLNSVKPVVERYDYEKQQFSDMAIDLFEKQNRVDALAIYQKDLSGVYQRLGDVEKDSDLAESFLKDEALIQKIRTETLNDEVVIKAYPNSERHVIVGYRLGEKDDVNHVILISLYQAEDLLKEFTASNLYNSRLIDANGRILVGANENLSKTLFSPALHSSTPEGTAEVKDEKQRSLLMSYSKVGLGSLIVVSLVDKQRALSAVDLMVSKSILFFVALLSATVLISVFASIRLTSTLRDLYEATRKIAQGEFDVRVESQSKDEIGGLATSFNWMAGEVSRLMSETAEAARMENELATVKTVQETLFPEKESQFGPFKIVGHFEPASECGGDWWSYSKIGDKLFLWIGDATGHGAPAALITSAAKSAAAIIETLDVMAPSKALEIMNRAIYETSKGRIMMTFFLGCIDLETQTMTYANASHDPPYLLRKDGDKPLKKGNLIPLMDQVGSRLGEARDSKYETTSIELQPGDAIFFYTDGIIDLNNPEGKAWGERQFVKTLLKAVNDGEDTRDKMEKLKLDISDYRKDSQLIDDITIFICDFDKVA